MGIPQTFRLAQLARRLLSLREAYTPNVAEEFLPTVELLYPGAPETFRLRDEVLALGANNILGQVGNFSVVDIEAAANTIFVCEQLALFATAAMQVQITTNIFARASRAVLSNLTMVGDSRAQVLPQLAPTNAQFLISTRATGALLAGTLMGLYALQANTTLIVPFRSVLYGGKTTDTSTFKVEVSGQTVNVGLGVAVSGWERNLEPSETF
jgi:hypothetical protein